MKKVLAALEKAGIGRGRPHPSATAVEVKRYSETERTSVVIGYSW